MYFIFQGQRSQGLNGLATAHCKHRWGSLLRRAHFESLRAAEAKNAATINHLMSKRQSVLYFPESPACVTPKFICNDVIARLAKWRVLATTGVCASARTELKRQRLLDIRVTDLCGKMVLEFGKLCRLYFFV